jgi:uncharacterized protein YoxC
MQVAEWSALAAAAAFVALAAVAIRTLLTARQAMLQASQAIVRLELQLEETGAQTRRLLQTTEAMAADIHGKLQALSPLAASVRDVGNSMSEIGGTVRQASRKLVRSVLEVEQAVHNHRARMQEALEWAATGVELWRRWQAGRNAHTERQQRENE